MATSGRVTTNTTYDSYFWVEWEQVGSQDVANNRTQIKWSCGLYSTHKFYSNAIKMSAFSINGTQVYGGGTYSNFTAEGKQQITSGTLWITHNTDGTKTFSISSFTGWLYSNYNYSANATSHTLTSIPRAASITAAPDFNDTDNPTITYSNPAGNSVTALEACISLTGATDDIKYRSIPKTGNSYPFELTDAERELLRSNTPGPSRKVRFYVRTKIGSSTLTSYLEKTFTMTENAATKPVVTINKVEPVSTLGEPFKSMYIQGKSKVFAELAWEGKYGASVPAYWIEVEGKNYSYPFETAPLSMSGEQKVKAIVRDSRGFYGYAEQEITVIDYSKPLVVPLSSENAILCYRSDGNGKRVGSSTSLWLKAAKSYHSVQEKNKCFLQWRWKSASRQWKDSDQWGELLGGDEGDDFDGLLYGEFDTKTAYTVQIRAIDDIGEYDIKTFDIPTEDVALHLGEGGKNVTVGSYCDYSKPYTFRSVWDATFDKGINGVYIRTVEETGGTEIHLQTSFEAWDAAGSRRQSFLVFGSANAVLVHGVCIVHNTGSIKANSITNCEATCEEGGVVKITLPGKSWDQFTVISALPFTILQ